MAQFRLDRIRFTWKGTWAGNTTYIKDDIVQYDGKSYVCLVGHTSTGTTQTLSITSAVASAGTATLVFNSAQTTAPFAPGSTIVISGYTGTPSAFNGSFTVTSCTTTQVQYTLAGTYTGTSGSVTGPAAGTVLAGTTYNGFYADLNQINTTVTPNVANPYWQLWFDGYAWQGNWKNSTLYNLGDIVRYNSLVYICNFSHTSVAAGLPLTATAVSGNGTNVTLSFANQLFQPYKVGSTIVVAGMAPTSLNGSYTVLNCTSSTVTFANTTTLPMTIPGTISGSYQIGLEYNQSYWTVYASTDNWTGDWLKNTTYRLNDIVKYGGSTYRCIAPHVSSQAQAFINVVSIQTGVPQTGFVTLNFTTLPIIPFTVGSTINVLGVSLNGYNNSYTVTGCTTTSVTFASATTGAATGGTITGVSQLGLEANAGSWQTFINSDKWSTDWTISTRYKLNDIIRYGGIVYRCIVAHLSAGTIALGLEADQNNWETVVFGVEYKSNWQGSFRYKIQDVVRYGANTYYCTTYHTSSTVFDATKWSIYAPGLEYRNAWNSSTLYIPGDIVKYGGYSYYSNTNNSSSTPNPSSTDWTLVTYGYTINGDWTSVTQYYLGNVVRRNGQLYVAILDNLNSDPNVSTLNWQLVVSGSQWFNKWIVGSIYAIGDLVTYFTTTYRCIQGHSATLLNSPITDTVYTYWAVHVQGDHLEVMSALGDITTYNTSPVALPIGTPGQNLQSTGTQVTWNTFGLINNVYYVSNTQGVDAPGYGTSLNSPFATIAYACKYVANGTYYQQAAYLLNANKQWIIAEMYNWMNYGKTTNRSPFSSSSVYDPQKTQRDAEYIIDGIIYDMTRGGNSQIVASAFSFFQPGTNTFYNTAIASEAPYFIAALNQVLSLMTSAISNTPPAQSYQTLTGAATASLSITGANGTGSTVTLTFAPQTNEPFVVGEVVSVSGTNPSAYSGNWTVTAVSTSSISFTSTTTAAFQSGGTILGSSISQVFNVAYVAESGTSQLMGSLMSIVTNALTNQTTGGIPPTNTGVTSTINIKDGTYNEIIPITVPENTAIVGDELRNTIVQPSSASATFVATISGTLLNVASVSSGTIVLGMYISGSTIYTPTQVTSQVSGTAGGPGQYIVNVSQSQLSQTMIAGYSTGFMFYCRNGSGIRNMTLSGLNGALGPLNTYLTSRPTAGAYVSLDPGKGPYDTSAWIFRKSPYVQNVTTFGTGCAGLKIDGALHNGGNKSIVANDFTQVLSDGIGCWCTGPGALTELVSVFTYYNHAGYLSELGGKIRATNGNSSYGTYGVVAESYDTTEVPIAGTVNNRYYQAQVAAVFAGQAQNKILKLEFSNCGQNYTSASYKISGAGLNASFLADEFRDNAIFEAHITGTTVGLGGAGYLTAGNQSGGGDTSTIYLATSDTNLAVNYVGMRLVIISGTGVGQYGYIQAYNSTTKLATIYKESTGTAGWDHIIAGTLPSALLDTTTQYLIEPRVTFSSPGFTATSTGVMTSGNWVSIAYGNGNYIALDGTGITNTSSNGSTWSNGTTLATSTWTATAYGNNTFVFISNGTAAAYYSGSYGSTSMPSSAYWSAVTYSAVLGNFLAVSAGGQSTATSTNGNSWSGGGSLPSSQSWSGVAYGSGPSVYVAVAGGAFASGSVTATNAAAYSINGSAWVATTMPSSANWSSVSYGNSRFVAIDLGIVGTSTSTKAAYSLDGITWTASTLPQASNWTNVSYGQGLFIATSVGTQYILTSPDGVNWTLQNTPASGAWNAIAFGNPIVNGSVTNTWVAVAGGASVLGAKINTGARAFGRAVVSSGTIGSIRLQDPGSGYTTTPIITITDPNVATGTLAQGTTTFTGSGISITTAASYTGITQLSTSGNGTGAVFNITKLGSGTSYANNIIVSITTLGSGYAVGDSITISGSNLGGSGANNLVLIVGTAVGTIGLVATTLCRTGTGVLANPTFINRGSGYQTSTTTVAVSGNGFADILQGPQNIIVDNVTTQPTPGASLVIAGNSTQYNIVLITQLSTNLYNFQLSINLDNSLQPAHGTAVTIRVKYSQVRLTGHDFLYIGTGNFSTTNYPNVNTNTALQNQQIQYNGGGRVFVVSTDQDGNFKVGNLFGVQQATGTVTISASLFNLNGITSLAIGGFSVGTNAVIINQFSTDSYFTANSDNIIPTQKAIKSYMARAIAAGGSNAFTSLLVAGTVGVGNYNGTPSVYSTTGTSVKVTNKMYFTHGSVGSQGVDGAMVAQIFFNSGGTF